MPNLFDPATRETDMIQLSVLVFLPAIGALLLLLIPSRFRELMRWVAIVASAVTLTLALCLLVDYHRLLESYSDRDTRSLYHPASRLDVRAEQQQIDAAQAVPKAFNSFDLLTRRPWIERFDINFSLGVDGVSLAMVILTALVTLMAVVASWTIEHQLRGYLALLLILESGVIGAFLAMDLFLFYVFYEVMLFPMYFLVGLWGGGRRKYAAIKFVIYTLLGSVALLAAIIALYTVDVRDFVDQEIVQSRAEEMQRLNPGLSEESAMEKVAVYTFDPFVLSKASRAAMLVINGQEDRLQVRDADAPLAPVGKPEAADAVPLFSPGVDRETAIARLKDEPITSKNFQFLLFGLLFFGFAVKVPIVPLHSWLPDAHVEAPTPVSMILAGVLLKLGGYGLYRYAFPLAPWAAAELAWWVGLIGVIGIVYGGLLALGQTDFKKLLAYSSVSHMGYVILGLAAWGDGDQYTHWELGVNGAIFQMIAHGITASAMFYVVGVVYDRAHHRDLDRFGGLMEPMPAFGGLSAVLFFASLGLPGLCGFVGEFMVLLSAWAFDPWLALPAILATILTAAYLLWAWQRVYFGQNPETKEYPEVQPREFLVLLVFAVLAIALGVIPSVLVFQWMEPSIYAWVENLSRLR